MDNYYSSTCIQNVRNRVRERERESNTRRNSSREGLRTLGRNIHSESVTRNRREQKQYILFVLGYS